MAFDVNTQYNLHARIKLVNIYKIKHLNVWQYLSENIKNAQNVA